MIGQQELEAVVAGEIQNYRGNHDETMADILIQRNREILGDDCWGVSKTWMEVMNGGGLERYEAEVRRQVADLLDGARDEADRAAIRASGGE